MENKFSGVWPAMLTPVNNDHTINFQEAEKLIDLFISQKMDGLYLLGSTGMGISFTGEQRKAFTAHVLNITENKIPVIVHVGANTTEQAINLARHAEEHGADGISSVGPIYYPSNTGMTLTHYQAIANAINLPFFPYQFGDSQSIQDYPGFVSTLLNTPNIKGMKLTTDRLLEISRTYNLSKGKLLLFSGNDELICQAALSGAIGAIGSTYNVWGPACKKVREAFVQGNFELANVFMIKYQAVIDEALTNFWTFLRQAMKIRYNINIGPSVAPLGNTDQEWKQSDVERMLEEVDSVAATPFTSTN